MGIAHGIAAVVTFIADLFTAILGAIAIYTILFKRAKLRQLLHVFLSSHFNEKVKRVKETLGKLEGLDFADKEDKAEIRNLLGQLSGQIKPLAVHHADLTRLQDQIQLILDNKTKLNEALKRQITYDLHGSLDNASVSAAGRFFETENE